MVKVNVGCRRLVASEPDAAAEVVLVISATKGAAETTGVELRSTRSSWRSPLGSGWPESTPASSAAAAGVRVRSESTLQGVWGGVSVCCVILVRCGAR